MAIRERPIIFSAESVRAILEGRKTQTRRAMKPQPESQGFTDSTAAGDMVYIWPHLYDDGWRDRFAKSPYGMVGERLWVRETWAHDAIGYGCSDTHCGNPDHIWYRATEAPIVAESFAGAAHWRSPIHMPRWASRITLEIVKVRVQRVWQISQWDCIQEGIVDVARAEHRSPEPGEAPIDLYGKLWDSINAKRGHPWSSNPWVWVIEFKRMEAS